MSLNYGMALRHQAAAGVCSSMREGELRLTARPSMKSAVPQCVIRRAEQVQSQPQPTDHQTACSAVAGLKSGWEIKSARQGQDWPGARPSTA